MSDFVHSGWSVFVLVATVASLAACLVLLFIASRRQPMGADNSTGHVFDEDLTELNNPLPLWWMVMFVLSVAFAFVYVFVFPGLGSVPGWLGWTSHAELAADQKQASVDMAKIYGPYTQLSAEALSKDAVAMAIGQRLFINNCATCHGSDARGSKGFPDLTDSDWLHGGSPAKIEETITLGRTGVMPPLAGAIGNAQDVSNVAHYVLSLSNTSYNSIAAYSGKQKFAVCAACHGADGKGNQALGAPNLADKVWLHGWGEAAITDIVTHGKTNVMPPQAGRMTPDQIHVLGSYVWSLSNAR